MSGKRLAKTISDYSDYSDNSDYSDYSDLSDYSDNHPLTAHLSPLNAHPLLPL